MEAVSRFMGAVSVYSSTDPLITTKQELGENVQIDTETVQSDNGEVTVTTTVKRTCKHNIGLRAFKENEN